MSEKKAVLILSQTAAGQMYLGVLLNRIWYAPVLATTAEEAVRLAPYTKFDLVLLDGDSTGFVLQPSIRLLRAEPSIKDLPLVLIITTEKAPNRSPLSDGVSAVLTKPLDLALLYGVLSSLTAQPRNTARIPVKFIVDIKEGIPEPKLKCVNLSESGMYLRTHKALPEKTAIHVRFTLPHNTFVIELASEVVRVKPLDTQLDAEPGMGLRFLNIPEDVRLKIRNYVQWEMMGDLEWKAGM